MKNVVAVLMLLSMLASCTSKKAGEESLRQHATDAHVLEELQGVWLDDNTELPLFKIVGDSIYYAGQNNVPQQFALFNDTLFVYGVQTVCYPIRRRTEHSMHFATPQGDQVSLHKSEIDSVYVDSQQEIHQPTQEVIQKDSVILFKGERYRGYAYINPTGIKVIRPGISEEGLSVDNVFYDNVIHICVYQGTRRLYSKDIKRPMFAGLVPDDFLNNSILSDMNFVDVNADGYIFEATLCMPDGPTCYNIRLFVDFEGNLTFKLCQ